ncbi:MAG: hypothetical protein HYS12_07415 [Planctomycetes bacterium]|nr:hypothetical protein [Planctomycetota bacterium]
MTSRDDLPVGDINLGPKQAEFGASNFGRILRACFALLLTGLGGVALVGLVTKIINGELVNLSRGFLVIFFCLGCAAALLWSARHAGRIRVELYADGLVLHLGSSMQACRWDDILVVTEIKLGLAEFYEFLVGVMSHQTHAFHLHLRSGEVIILPNYIRGLARLGYTIKAATLPRLVVVSLAELDGARSVSFGPIRLSPDGIEVNDKQLPWGKVKRVKRLGNWLDIHRRGALLRWKRFNLGEVPNAHVLEEIVAQRSGARAEK